MFVGDRLDTGRLYRSSVNLPQEIAIANGEYLQPTWDIQCWRSHLLATEELRKDEFTVPRCDRIEVTT